MRLIDSILTEFEQEAKATRKMLEVVPEDKLDWQPHEKSMSLGRLAAHLAEIAGWVDAFIEDELDMGASDYKPPTATNIPETLESFDNNVSKAVKTLKPLTDEQLLANWRMKSEGKVLMELPRIAVIKTWLINHVIHHRGQLSVYLRINGVSLPQVYGPTADEPGM